MEAKVAFLTSSHVIGRLGGRKFLQLGNSKSRIEMKVEQDPRIIFRWVRLLLTEINALAMIGEDTQ
jgi:hypothetical protein